MAHPDTKMRVEIVYALPETQVLIEVEVEPGATAAEAVERSGILQRFPGLELRSHAIGIYGKVVMPEHVLNPEDRVEIYRPLIADPKEARRRRAAKRRGAKDGAAG